MIFKNIIHFIRILLFASLLLCSICFIACDKTNFPEVDFPEVSTGVFKPDAGLNSGTIQGTIQGLRANSLTEDYGHIWSTKETFDFSQKEGQYAHNKRGANGNFESPSLLEDLSPETTYFCRAYLIINNEVLLGETISFTLGTPNANFKIDKERITINRDEQTMTIFTAISDLKEGLSISSYGIVWAPHPLPKYLEDNTVEEPGIIIDNQIANAGLSYSTIINPNAGVNYIRPFIVTGNKAIYGSVQIVELTDIWNPTSDFPEPIKNAIGFSIGNKGYIGGSKPNSTGFWEFTPATFNQDGSLNPSQWEELEEIPISASGGIGFSIGNKAYVGGGSNGLELYEYDRQLPDHDGDGKVGQWRKMESLSGAASSEAIVFVLGNKAYIGTGRTQRNDMHEFDPSKGELDENRQPKGSWRAIASFPGFRETAVAFGIEIAPNEWRGYLGLGSGDAGGGGLHHKDLWEYNPLTNKWSQKASFPPAIRAEAVGFTIGQKGYVGTGQTFAIERKDFYEFDPTDASLGTDINGNPLGKWTKKADVGGFPRQQAIGFNIGNKGYIGTGKGLDTFKDFWEYTPE